ncbi:hypothetical protein HYALB_00005095 [Hymenoscyphus albidus]|uniref:Uncharacterized protein n=1 Tax=Hymenoscyphus albidus TaxID=595503 RepID=A0A9N9LYA5_9HELO|nr:hypothetical protein HYALB_00005095 [Hymenoscyphus albidus]
MHHHETLNILSPPTAGFSLHLVDDAWKQSNTPLNSPYYKLPREAREFAYLYIKGIRDDTDKGWKFVERCANKALMIRQWGAVMSRPDNSPDWTCLLSNYLLLSNQNFRSV